MYQTNSGPKREPSLDDLIGDPTCQIMMRRDRVDPEALRLFLRDMASAVADARADA